MEGAIGRASEEVKNFRHLSKTLESGDELKIDALLKMGTNQGPEFH